MNKTADKKVLIATGGTGGHLFPAQALARSLIKTGSIDVLFAGKGLGSNRCFHKQEFPFEEISSASLMTSKPSKLLTSSFTIAKGIKQSLSLIKKFDPDLVMGFGSFYSFPLICAALMKKVPYVLFEPNAEAGKVNRLFSKWAEVTAIQFAGVAEKLSGEILEVSVPLWEKEERKSITEEEARACFCLDPKKTTILVFGGSQGAAFINNMFIQAVPNLWKLHKDFQVIHIAGDQDQADMLRRSYDVLGIPASVKTFEERMNLAWRAASFVICRAGAASLAEEIAFEVPGILIPYPYASDDHQRKNAQFMEEHVRGAVHLSQSYLTPEILLEAIKNLVDPVKKELERMRLAIADFKASERKAELTSVIQQILQDNHVRK